MDYKEFTTEEEALKALAELDAKNGYPIKGNVTLTSATIEKANGAFYLNTEAIDKQIDTSKSKDVTITKQLLSDKSVKFVRALKVPKI